MARIAHTLNYRRATTNYSCRAYDGKEGQPYALTFLADGVTCYVPLVSKSSAYASYLHVMYGGTEYSPAKLMTEYKGSWTLVGSQTTPGSTVYSRDIDYDQVYSSSSLYNVKVTFNITGTITPQVRVDGTMYTMTTNPMYFRVRAADAGKGSPTSIQIEIFALAVPPYPPYSGTFTTTLEYVAP